LPAPEHPKPYVREELDSKSMHFGVTEIQSRMQIRAPDALQLEYTRMMMGFLLWNPEPSRVLMLGLGGGSMAKFCHRYLPNATIVAVEINPHVIAVRDAFDVPADSARFKVVEADAARFVAETDERFDVMLVDCFDADGMPEALGSQRFYDDACDALAPSGIFVANLHAGHPHFPVHVDRIQQSFGDRALRVDDSDGSNSVVFANKGGELVGDALKPSRKPASLDAGAWTQVQGAFSRIAHAARQREA
jgi:spermidine synthase